MSNTLEGRARDHESDPAHNIEEGHEWVDEGGASHLGPATHLTAAHPDAADETAEPDEDE